MCGYWASAHTHPPHHFHQHPSVRCRLPLNINPSPSFLHYASMLITCSGAIVCIDFPPASAHLDAKLFWPQRPLSRYKYKHAYTLGKIPSHHTHTHTHGSTLHTRLWLPERSAYIDTRVNIPPPIRHTESLYITYVVIFVYTDNRMHTWILVCACMCAHLTPLYKPGSWTNAYALKMTHKDNQLPTTWSHWTCDSSDQLDTIKGWSQNSHGDFLMSPVPPCMVLPKSIFSLAQT